MVTKGKLLDSLPFQQDTLTIRELTREDIDLLSEWPGYPFPYEVFRFSFAMASSHEKDEAFRTRHEKIDSIVLVADCLTHPAVGYIAPTLINWETGVIGNFGFRIHPAWCDQGLGTAILRAVTRWSFEHGITSWHLDVAASNARAIRCYEKVGFDRTGEIWREATDLSDVNVDTARYDFVRPHIRKTENTIELRFWLMTLEAGTQEKTGQPHAVDS